MRAPSRGEADGVGELRVCGKIQFFDQSESDRLIVPLAQQIQKRLGFLDIALGRMRVKEAGKELNRIAQMFGCDAERVSLPKTLGFVMPFSAPQEPAVKPIEALVG